MSSPHKSEDYKISAVKHYLTSGKSQEEICDIFKCSARSLMRWADGCPNEFEKTFRCLVDKGGP